MCVHMGVLHVCAFVACVYIGVLHACVLCMYGVCVCIGVLHACVRYVCVCVCNIHLMKFKVTLFK